MDLEQIQQQQGTFKKPFESGPDIVHARVTIEASIAETGFEGKLDDALMDRLIRLERHSKFNLDSRMVASGMQNILHYMHKQSGGGQEEHDRLDTEALIAALVHDIGKSGPASANASEQEAVVRLFAAENINDPAMPVGQAIALCFEPAETPRLQVLLEHCGITADMTMREFWDKHAYWTKDILEQHPEGIAERTRIIAASHHIDRGINPYHIKETGAVAEAKAIGASEYYLDALHGKLLLAVDKYQASIRRSGRNHDEALAVIKRILGNGYEKDDVMKKILDAIDALGRNGTLFSKSGVGI